MIRLVVILFLSCATLSRADSVADKLTASGIAEFTAAYQAWDGAGFARAAALFRQAGTNDTAGVTNLYWLGVAEFHRMLQLQTVAAQEEAIDAARNSAIKTLADAVKMDETLAEGHALLGTLQGMKINGSVLRGLWFGPGVAKHREAAMKWGASNPRVRYLLGMCRLHTAHNQEETREALNILLKAEALFKAESKIPAAALEPRWGYDSCLTFIGRAYEMLGSRAEAADYFRKALEKHPQDQIARVGLRRIEEGR